jgi:thiamine-monophosphate kinase
MKVSELGEFGLIDILAKTSHGTIDRGALSGQKLILGIGDDAAAWYGDDSIQLATTDSLIEGIHFSLDTISWEELGWKSLAVNLSDIAAMGGLPSYSLVSLALPGNTEVDDVISLYKGMVELANIFDVSIIGGDTCGAPVVVINITVIGSTGNRDNPILTRSAAKAGNQIAVTGYLGGSAACLEMLSKNVTLDSNTTAILRKTFFKPYPRITEGRLLVENGVISAIDISDGLIADCSHICRMSNVSARIEIDRVPVLPAVRDKFGYRAIQMALSGGEDYELLFTADAGVIEKTKEAVSCPITIIGEITGDKTSGVTLVDNKGNHVSITGKGWEHFTTGKDKE